MPPAKGKKAVAAAEKAIEPPSNVQPGTPDGSHRKHQPTITVAQKQALIDNLQLEITERARKLRATYSLHTQGLRSRLEMRINRIPQSLRSTNIMELIDKYSEDLDPPKPRAKDLLSKPLPDLPTLTAGDSRPNTASSPSPSRGLKRSSDHFTSDKENITADLENPKKRTKTAAAPVTRAGRAATRKVNPASVLSPRSHNSRALPQSPLRPLPSSPPKSLLARPISPAKSVTSMAPPASTAATRAKTGGRAPGKTTAKTNYAANTGTVRTKRGAVAPAAEAKQPRSSDGSHASESSNGTTIVTKKPATAKRSIVRKMTGMATGAKKTASKKEAQPAAATGRTTRALRSRK